MSIGTVIAYLNRVKAGTYRLPPAGSAAGFAEGSIHETLTRTLPRGVVACQSVEYRPGWIRPHRSSPDNLGSLAVGQQITLNVTLSGLLAGDQLDELGTDISFPAGTFNVSAITPG